MDKIQPYIDEYKVSLITGGVAVGLGLLAKKLLKKEVLPLQSVRKGVESFVFLSVSGIVVQHIQKMQKKSP